jgi:MFS family permease
MPAAVAFLGGLLPNIAGVGAVLFGGWLSDRVGRRPVMIWPGLVHLVLILPVYFWITSARSAESLFVGTSALAIFSGIAGGGFYAAITESLPKRIRGGTFAIVYATSIALFGGTTQPLITWLIHVTHNPMAPAIYLAAATVVGLGARMLIVESAPVKILAQLAVASTD